MKHERSQLVSDLANRAAAAECGSFLCDQLKLKGDGRTIIHALIQNAAAAGMQFRVIEKGGETLNADANTSQIETESPARAGDGTLTTD
jgi:hypothetical protein